MKGSCLCGEVVYEITGTSISMTHCHCSMCRKHHGAAYVTFLAAYTKDFRFLAGEEKISYFRSSAPVQRGFCSCCGSSLNFLYEPMPELLWVSAGTLDELPDREANMHIWVGSKAPWHEISDSLPQHEKYPSQSTLG